MDAMKELYEKVSKDVTLQEKFTMIMKDAEKAGEEATKEKLISFAKEAGYAVTTEEMQEFFKGLAETKEGELSDAELDQVAGGKGGLTLGTVVSIFGFGLGCAVTSLIEAAKNINCGDYLAKDVTRN